MAYKKGKATSKPDNPNFRGFININLTEDVKKFIKSQPFSSDVFEANLWEYIQIGYKFNFGYDDYQHCYQCIGTRSDREHTDYGILLTGRGSSPMKAFKQWMFMVTEIIGEKSWTEMLAPQTSNDYDD